MKHGWEVKKLGDVFQIKPPKREAREKLSEDSLVTFLPMEDLGIIEKETRPIQTRALKEVTGSYTYFAENDVLLAKITPCFENGKLGIAKNLTNGIGFGSSEYIVFRSNGEVRPDFLFYFLSRSLFREEGKNFMGGAVGQQRVSKDWIENYLIPFPKSISEQKHIVSILDGCITAIDKAKANAEQNLKNAKELFESYLQGVFENENWEVKKLGELCEFVRGPFGGSLKKNIFRTEGYAVYEQQHAIYDQFDKIRYFIDENKFKEMQRFELNTGDLIMSCSGTMGKVAIVPDKIKKGIINQALLKITPSNKLLSVFVKLWMQSASFQDSLKDYSGGAAIQNVASVATLKNIEIPLPPLKEQQAIVRQLDALRAETQKLEAVYQQKIADLEELRKSVLQKAFEGNI